MMDVSGRRAARHPLRSSEKNGLTQIAAAKKYHVSAVTIWKWGRDAKTSSRTRAPRGPRAVPSNESLAMMVRAEVQARVREMVPEIVREEVAQVLGSKLRM